MMVIIIMIIIAGLNKEMTIRLNVVIFAIRLMVPMVKTHAHLRFEGIFSYKNIVTSIREVFG